KHLLSRSVIHAPVSPAEAMVQVPLAQAGGTLFVPISLRLGLCRHLFY
ncbi:MAG: hypothetical protein RL617_217, partial [Pseudomonadota bacterium]